MPASLTSSASVPPVPGLTNVYCAAVGRPAAAQDVLPDLARGRLGQLVDELNSWPSTLCRGYIEASPTLGRRSIPACLLSRDLCASRSCASSSSSRHAPPRTRRPPRQLRRALPSRRRRPFLVKSSSLPPRRSPTPSRTW